MKGDGRSRGWCFTVNNYDDDDIAYVMSLYEEDVNCTYLIVGFEKAGRTGTEHMQCYIYYTNPLTVKHMRKKLKPWHVEAQKAAKNVQAYCYCMEDDDYIEFGDRPRQGHRTDLEVIKHDIKSGRPMKEIANNYFSQWCQYRRAFEEFRLMNRPRYITEIVLYDDKEMAYCMQEIFRRYSLDNSKFYDGMQYWNIYDYELYLKGVYKYMFVPMFMANNGYIPKEFVKDCSIIEKKIYDDSIDGL